jgi:hypothetical protein
MGGVTLDIFQGLVVESGGLRAAPGAHLLFNLPQLQVQP